MATRQLAIPAFRVPKGAHIFGPVTPAGPWSHFDISLDMATAPAFDVLVEESLDGGATWGAILQVGGAQPIVKNGVPITTLEISGDWVAVHGSTQVRVTTTSPSAWQSAGGTITVS